MQFKTVQIRKSCILNKQVSILSSNKIKKPFTPNDYINNHIPSTELHFLKDKKDYIVGFSNNDVLNNLKKRILHPYNVSRLMIADLMPYIHKSDNIVIILNNNYLLLLERDNLNSLDDCIPVQIHKYPIKLTVD